MKRSRRIGAAAGSLFLTTVLLFVFVAVLLGCGSEAGEPGPDTTAAQPGTAATVSSTNTSAAGSGTTLPAGPPTLAEVEGYHEWLKMNVEPVQGRTHGLTDIYINQDRDAIAPDGTLAFPFPDGTVIVKEQVEGSLVAIMRKTAGVDPEHGNWEWVEYGMDGKVVGEDAGCWTCHADARGTDWVFTELATQ